MQAGVEGRRHVRLGPFEVDLQLGEVRANGHQAKLQEQPLQILALLLERPGELVTREEIRQKLWPDGIVVDFEHSINTAVKKLREALGDDAENPRFIETLPRHGYRLIAPVDGAARGGAPVVAAVYDRHPKSALIERRYSKRRAAIAVSGALLIAAGLLAYWLTRPLPPPSITHIVQLTNNGRGKIGRLLTDGPRLYFWEDIGGRATLVVVSTAGGETVPVPVSLPGQLVVPLDISPDGSELLVRSWAGATGMAVPLWTLPVLGGSPRRVGDVLVNVGHHAAWSPDGQKIVYARGNALHVVGVDGSASHQLLEVKSRPAEVRWSPDGKHVRFTLRAPQGEGSAIWQVEADGSSPHQLLPGWSSSPVECCGAWTASGKYFIFQAARDNEDGLWAIREKTDFFHKASYRPVRLTSGPVHFESVAPSRDGKRLFALGTHARIELMRYDARSHQFAPYLGGISASEVDFSKDGEWACYSAYPEATLWRSKVDGSQKLQLTFPPMAILMPRWSPDGKRIAYMGQMPGKPWKTYVISADGGTPQQLIQDQRSEADPQWSLDGSKILFGRWGVASASEPEQTKALYLLDLATGQVTKLPNSEGVFSPRWSPDGRYVVALDLAMQKLILFDLMTGGRIELATFEGGIGFPNWSHDGKSILIYGRHSGYDDSIYRVRLSDRNVQSVLSIEELAEALGNVRPWGFALAPDDSILITRDHTMTEVYALDWEAP